MKKKAKKDDLIQEIGNIDTVIRTMVDNIDIASTVKGFFFTSVDNILLIVKIEYGTKDQIIRFLGEEKTVYMRWLGRLFLTVVLFVANFYQEGCNNNIANPCGKDCPKGEKCDVTTKRCIPKNCFPCSNSVECGNDEYCYQGCCQPLGSKEQITTKEKYIIDGGIEDTPLLDDSSFDKLIREKIGDKSPQPPENICTEPPCSTKCKQDSDCSDPVNSLCD